MSRFDQRDRQSTAIAQAAYAVVNHGFVSSEFGSTHEDGEWNGLVAVSPTILLNLGELHLKREMERVGAGGEYDVWLVEDAHGFVYAKWG